MLHFPSGEGEYQDVLNALVGEGLPEDADWLIDHAGPDSQAMIEVDSLHCRNFFAAGRLVIRKEATVSGILRAGGSIEAHGDIVRVGLNIEAGGDIKSGWSVHSGRFIQAGGDIESGSHIQAGYYIQAGGDIKAGGSVQAGWSIKAGGYIKQGKGYGIFAGLDIEIADWPIQGRVIAKAKPDNLMSGHWAGGSEGEA
jgi:UDP-3-O-[3-hydroxymyristoyl] glucosamine N-acyltransferase